MVIGVCGLIGSGKSLVCKYLLEQYNMTVLNEDIIADDIMDRIDTKEELVETFGKEILDEDDNINKVFLKRIISEATLDKLNKIVHPKVFEYVDDYIKEDKNQDIIIETALPNEARLSELCDYIIIIKRDIKKRVRDVMLNRSISEENFLLINNRQTDNILFSNIYTVDNNTTEEDLYNKIDLIMEQIL